MAFVSLKNVSYDYGSTRAIVDLSLAINQGEWVAVVGPNGSGKSTLTKLLIGLLSAKEGTIEVNGLAMNTENVQSIRESVGIIFQNPDNQFVGVTVKDDIAFGLENIQVPYEEMVQRIDAYALKVGMQEYLEKEPSQLSGGQKQRVAIAGTLAMQPELLIFDEATSMLDPAGRHEMMTIMKSLHQEGKTLLTITHDLRETLHADRIVVMHEGRILNIGAPKDILLDEKSLKEAKLSLLEPFKYIKQLQKLHALTEEWEALLWQSALNL